MSHTFHSDAKYKGFNGFVIAKQEPAPINGMVRGWLVAFPKPVKTKIMTDEVWQRTIGKFAEVFECDPDRLGPCINKIIPEDELFV